MKMIFDLDLEKCVACGACAVACMDQNDIHPDAGEPMLRVIGTLEPRVNDGNFSFLSLSCMHCTDAPCVVACPAGCLYKNKLGLTVYDRARCIGCRSCAMACPYGAPKYAADGRLVKCSGCAVRQENGLLPACVRVCPTKALLCVPEARYPSVRPAHSLRDQHKY